MARCFVAAALLAVACGQPDAGPPIETAALAAAVRLPVPIELVDEIRYVTGRDDGVVVVARNWPHVRELREDGGERHVPGGMRAAQPWGGHARGDSLWIFGTESWALWSLDGPAELQRGSLPARTVAATHGCGERLVAIFAGGNAAAAELAGEYGLRAYDGDAWWTLTPLAAGENPAIFTAGEAGAVAVLPTGEIALFNGAMGRIEILPCGPYGQRTVDVPALARELLPPRPRGLAAVDGVLVWFWSPAGDNESETRTGYWVPGRGVRAGPPVIGNVRLYGNGSAVWLLDVSAAELIRLDAPEFLGLLGVRRR